MSQDAEAFIGHLQRLKERDLGAMAALRHSLTFAPGDYPKAYPHVERYVGRDWHSADSRRLARYAVAGLFATHPVQHDRSLASAFGQMVRDKGRESLELRFIALLEADADSVMNHLRQLVRLLASAGLGYDHAALLGDLSAALNERTLPDHRDRIRRQWARDFYRALQADASVEAIVHPAESAD